MAEHRDGNSLPQILSKQYMVSWVFLGNDFGPLYCGHGRCCVKTVSNAYVCFYNFRPSHDLKKEAQMLFLQHVNIVTMLAIIFELGHYGLVMEYVLHGGLEDFLFHYDV